MTTKNESTSPAIKIIFLAIVGYLINHYIFKKSQPPFIPSKMAYHYLWFINFPLTLFIFFYFTYINKKLKYNIDAIKQQTKNSVLAHIKACLIIMIFAGGINVIISAELGTLNSLIATQKISERVKIASANCFQSQRGGDTNLILYIMDNHQQYQQLSFPYPLCEQHPDRVKQLQGQWIILYGRQNIVGKNFDYFVPDKMVGA